MRSTPKARKTAHRIARPPGSTGGALARQAGQPQRPHVAGGEHRLAQLAQRRQGDAVRPTSRCARTTAATATHRARRAGAGLPAGAAQLALQRLELDAGREHRLAAARRARACRRGSAPASCRRSRRRGSRRARPRCRGRGCTRCCRRRCRPRAAARRRGRGRAPRPGRPAAPPPAPRSPPPDGRAPPAPARGSRARRAPCAACWCRPRARSPRGSSRSRSPKRARQASARCLALAA